MHPKLSRPPLKIFLVEDSIPVRQRLAALIATIADVEIIGEADDARAALTGIAATGAEVVLIDLHLIKGKGMDIIEALSRSSLPVLMIVLTNYATEAMREACLSGGADYFFDKTTEFTLALETIKKIVRERIAGGRKSWTARCGG